MELRDSDGLLDETCRHIDAVGQRLLAEIQLVLQRVQALNQNLDRWRDDMRAGFRQVDARLTRLEALVSSPKRCRRPRATSVPQIPRCPLQHHRHRPRRAREP